MNLKRENGFLVFLTIFAILSYEYSCIPANVSPDAWEEWIRNELWKMILSESLAIFAYLIIFFHCFGYKLCVSIARVCRKNSKCRKKTLKNTTIFCKIMGLINVLVVLAYAYSSTRADTVPNNHLFYNKAGLRYALPILFILICIVYTAYHANFFKVFVSVIITMLILFQFLPDSQILEHIQYNASKAYCQAPVRRNVVKLHQIMKTMVEFIPLLYTCRNTFDVSWMDRMPGRPKLLAYPDITKWGMNEEMSKSIQIIAKNVDDNLIDLKGNISKISEHEFVVSRINQTPEVFVKTVRRKDIKREVLTNKYENLFVLFIDSASRAFVEVYLPKSLKLLKKWKDELRVNYHTYLRYQHFPGRSRGNRTPFFVGYSYEYLKSQAAFTQPTFTKLLQNEGFISGYVTSSCQLGFWGPMAVNFTWLFNVPRKFFVDENHHQMAFCDRNFLDHQMPLRFDKGPWAIGKHCIYGKQISELAGNYASSFFHTYNDKKKFMYVDLLELHDPIGTNLESIDDSIFETLRSLEEFTSNTTFVIHADHPHLTLLDKPFHLPYLSIIRPKHHQIPTQSELNQQKLYTVYDLRSTLLDIFSIENYREQEALGRNLYTDELPSRTCEQVHIPYGICNCN